MVIHPLHTGLGVSFLLEFSEGLYLIDCGSPGQQNVILQKMRELGRSDLRLIWITHAHYDHYGNAAALRVLTGAMIGVHPADASSLAAGKSPAGTARGRGVILLFALALMMKFRPPAPVRADFTIGDNGSLAEYDLDATVLHTPGHTPGHTCLQLSDGTVFAGDLIARNPRARLQDLLATDWRQLPASLARLKAACPLVVYTGHSTHPLSAETIQAIRVKGE